VKLIKALLARIKRHNIPIFAAAIAFFGFFALVPTLTGLISGYGLIANEQDVIDLVSDGLSSQPESTRSFVEAQMTDIVNQQGAGIALGISIFLAFFSASGAVANLMKALNVVYDVVEDRKFLQLRGTAFGLLVGSLLVMGAAMFVMSALPAILEEVNLSIAGQWALRIARFPVLALIMMAALSVLYQVGPNHKSKQRSDSTHQPLSLVPASPHRMRLVTLGGLVATVLFVIFTYLFGLYATSPLAGGAAGILGTITAIMVWFQLIALAVLVGAEINAIGESGELTTQDS
jgi:membrane protein